jgi:predicted NAD/FAD-dependent oxidoreductase
VLHASADWSRQHLDETPEVVAHRLWQALSNQIAHRLTARAGATCSRWWPFGAKILW